MSKLLDVRGLTKRFGGLVANQAVDLAIDTGEIHALIGPNGAGKTTFIGQIAGQLTPDTGEIRFDGTDIRALKPHQRALRGLARSFQITSIFPTLSVLENVALAAQPRFGHSFRFWTPADAADDVNGEARTALRETGLAAKERTLSANLSHGEHRQLEIAMALVGKPKLLLMDEPTAGMGPEESLQLIGMLRELRSRCAILLVEHDMDVVFSLADRVTVLDNGRAIACGTPDAIRRDERVKTAYLGQRQAKPK